jgi:hypothetical protein
MDMYNNPQRATPLCALMRTKMMDRQPSDKSQLLTDLPSYVYGTTRLGDGNLPFEDRVRTARAAMEGTTWFHTSHTYGNALEVLRAAFDQDRTRVPKLIVKIGWQRTDELRDVIIGIGWLGVRPTLSGRLPGG